MTTIWRNRFQDIKHRFLYFKSKIKQSRLKLNMKLIDIKKIINFKKL